MQIPGDWYAYILPGVVYLAAAFLMLPKSHQKNIQEFFESNPILPAILLTIVAYCIGFSSDTVLVLGFRKLFMFLGILPSADEVTTTQRVLFYQYAANNLVGAVTGAYIHYVFLRNIWPALLFLSIVVFWKGATTNQTGKSKLLYGITIMVFAGLLGYQWYVRRNPFLEFNKSAHEYIERDHQSGRSSSITDYK